MAHPEIIIIIIIILILEYPVGSTSLYGLHRDVPLDRVWFLASLS